MRGSVCRELRCDAIVHADPDDPSRHQRDTDTDNAADTGASPSSALDCDAEHPTPDPGQTDLGTCVTQDLHCGDRSYGAFEGGSSIYGCDYWDDQAQLAPYLGGYIFLDAKSGSTR